MALQTTQRSTDNALAALEFADADELAAKTRLARKINDLVTNRGLSQADAARLLGMRQAKLSAIRDYRLGGISLDRLMLALAALGQRVAIAVRPAEGRARLDVAA